MKTAARSILSLIAALYLVLSLTANTQATEVYPNGNFNETVTLDTTQVEPNSYEQGDFICFRSEEFPEWGCVPALTADPRIFTDSRITDIQLVKKDLAKTLK